MASTTNQAVRVGRSDGMTDEFGAGRKAGGRSLRASSMAALVAGALAVALTGMLPATAMANTADRGYVAAWGDNSHGQTQVPSAAQRGIVAISAGGEFAMALTWDEKVVAWGDDHFGQTNVPAGLSHVKAISAGNMFAVALKSDGSVVAWGDDTYHETEVPAAAQSGVVAISAGDGFVVALKSDGSIVAWGNDNYGATDIPYVNVKVGSVYLHVPLSNLKSASTGDQVLGLKQDGTVVAWGRSDFGQTNVPSGLGGITAVSAGEDFSLALDGNGIISAWGDNTLRELNTPCNLYNYLTHTCVNPVSGFSAIAAGGFHALALRNGYVYAWGDDSYGQTTLPGSVTGQGFVAVAAGANFSLALWETPSAPGAPYAVSAAAGNMSAKVTWEDYEDNGAPITSYTVTSSPGGKTCTTSGGKCTVTGLTNGKAYTFTVTATNGIGTSPASVPTAPVTPHA